MSVKIDIHEDSEGWRLTLDGNVLSGGAHESALIAAALKAAPSAQRDNTGRLFWPDRASAGHAVAAARRAAGVMP